MLTAEEIRAIRKLLGMTPTQFAGRVGVSENTVRRWEIGDRHPKWEHVVILNGIKDDLKNGRNGRRNGK